MAARLARRGVVLALIALTPAGAAAATTDAPAGTYRLDPTHASLSFRVDHLGLSRYTARFTRFDAELEFNPADPARMRVSARVDPLSLTTDFPEPGLDFDAQIQGKGWLEAAQFPQITFQSTAVELTGPNTARVAGQLQLHGVTRPVVLEATFNGGYARIPMDPSEMPRIGFSAQGSLSRSAFGISTGVPAPGSRMGVGDTVEFFLEVEFVRPKAATP